MSYWTSWREWSFSDGPTNRMASDQSDEETRDDGLTKELSDHEIFGILANGRRRSVLSYLLQDSQQVSVKELTRSVAADEYGVSPDRLTPDQHKRVYTALYQCHLPRLDSAGMIDFDDDANIVTRTEATDRVEPYLPENHGAEIARLEVAFSILLTTVVILGVAGIGPFSSIPVAGWSVVTVIALFAMGIMQLFGLV